MSVAIEGSCLSGGFSKLTVANDDRFKVYVRNDSGPPIKIPLRLDNIRVCSHSHPHLPPPQKGGGKSSGCFVALGHKPRVNVVEHLFSALYGLSLFNVKIDIFGEEIPFFDGSSQSFVEVLGQLQEKRSFGALRLQQRILVESGSAFILYEPSEKNKLLIEMEFFHPYIRIQRLTLEINREKYISEIAPARTFVFTDEDDPRLKNLPPYGIGVTKNNIYSKEPLRFPDEYVRHKMLDLLGDLYVLRKKLVGKITCRNTSHSLNMKFITNMLNKSI